MFCLHCSLTTYQNFPHFLEDRQNILYCTVEIHVNMPTNFTFLEFQDSISLCASMQSPFLFQGLLLFPVGSLLLTLLPVLVHITFLIGLILTEFKNSTQ
jgi:hypothetical protein